MQMTADSRGRAPILVCFNAKFSPNLGDGLLSECLESGLRAEGADPATTSVDLAARQAYGDVMTGRGTVMAVLDALPGPLRRAAVRLPLKLASLKSWGPHYERGLAGADGVVIGGGNLISDHDLNFPTKLSLAIDKAAARDLPIALYACGMASEFSATGLRMFRRAFARPEVKAVFLRDPGSVAAWNRLMADATGKPAHLVRDPGLLAARHLPQPPRPARSAPVIGLGIMSQLAIRYHVSAAPATEALDRWYLDTARALLLRGAELHLFTNGSPEDRQYLDRLLPGFEAMGQGLGLKQGQGRLRILNQRNPDELCAHLAGFDALIAYRMHAVIGAFSYGVPAVALAWDGKLAEFMASVERADWLRRIEDTPPETCADLALRAAAEGLPAALHTRVVDEAAQGIAQLRALF